jgi:hypothetical protein
VAQPAYYIVIAGAGERTCWPKRKCRLRFTPAQGYGYGGQVHIRRSSSFIQGVGGEGQYRHLGRSQVGLASRLQPEGQPGQGKNAAGRSNPEKHGAGLVFLPVDLGRPRPVFQKAHRQKSQQQRHEANQEDSKSTVESLLAGKKQDNAAEEQGRVQTARVRTSKLERACTSTRNWPRGSQLPVKASNVWERITKPRAMINEAMSSGQALDLW